MYKYEEWRDWVFTDEGQKMLLRIRDKADRLIEVAGAFTVQQCITGLSGSSWNMLACLDRLVELKELHYLAAEFDCTQTRVLVRHPQVDRKGMYL
jgi:hypothetical protein